MIASNERKSSQTIPESSALPANIYFGFGHDDLTPAATGLLDGARVYMTYHREASVSLVGHIDPIGTNEANMALGLRRADRVAAYLQSGGVEASRVKRTSVGESGLITTNPRQYWRDRVVTLSWETSAVNASHDPALEKATQLVQSRIGPAYLAEKRFPEPVEPENAPIPEWHWGRLEPDFQAKVADWVKRQITPYTGSVASAPELDPQTIPVPVIGSITIEPRPIVKDILDDLLRDPIAFLNAGFGESAGP